MDLCDNVTYDAVTVTVQTVGVNNGQRQKYRDVKIYPNPAREQVTLEVSEKDNREVVITDFLGRLSYKASFSGKMLLPLYGWQRGVYSVQVTTAEGYRSIQKLLIQ